MTQVQLLYLLVFQQNLAQVFTAFISDLVLAQVKYFNDFKLLLNNLFNTLIGEPAIFHNQRSFVAGTSEVLKSCINVLTNLNSTQIK